MASVQPHPSSYRDPAGYLYWHEGQLYRQVNKVFQQDFDLLQRSGLSQHLVDKGLLTSYEIVGENYTQSGDWYQTLKPSFLPFISYPYEWCFDMLKDAALATLTIAKEAIEYGMHLKDASAYNLQWNGSRMQFIDTLSFEAYDPQEPWIAYRQFCEHFFAPLALMHYQKEPLQPLLLAWPDGLPLPVAKKLLPSKSRWNLHTYLHLHLQAKLSQKASGKPGKKTVFSKNKMKQLLESLLQSVGSFSLNQPSGVWSDYYEEANQREDYVQQKKSIITDWLTNVRVESAIDAGANEGEFSLLLAQKGIHTISADFDHFSVNNLYRKIKTEGLSNIHPLIIDLSNPTPALGVNNAERASLFQRVNCDLVLALAVIHHLAIGKNIDFKKIAELFLSFGRLLIIEFVPKDDEKIKLMLQHKRDVYAWYTEENFLQSFLPYYKVISKTAVGTSGRTLYFMEQTT